MILDMISTDFMVGGTKLNIAEALSIESLLNIWFKSPSVIGGK